MPSSPVHSCLETQPQSRLEPQKITFPAHDADEWAKGDRRTAAFDVSVDKLVSHNLQSAPDIEELVSRISEEKSDSNFKLSDFLNLQYIMSMYPCIM